MPKLQHVTIEDIRRARTPCPRKECDGSAAEIVMPGYQYKQCNDCGHRYGFRDGKGRPVSEREWKELRGKAVARHAGVRLAREGDAQDSEGDGAMAKKMKKTAKSKTSAKAKSTGGTDARKPLIRVFYDFMIENPGCSIEDVAAAGAKAFPKKEMNLRSIRWYRSMWSRGKRLPKGITKALPTVKKVKPAPKTKKTKKTKKVKKD